MEVTHCTVKVEHRRHFPMNESSSSLFSCEQFLAFFPDEEIHEKSQGSNQRWELEADLGAGQVVMKID